MIDSYSFAAPVRRGAELMFVAPNLPELPDDRPREAGTLQEFQEIFMHKLSLADNLEIVRKIEERLNWRLNPLLNRQSITIDQTSIVVLSIIFKQVYDNISGLLETHYVLGPNADDIVPFKTVLDFDGMGRKYNKVQVLEDVVSRFSAARQFYAVSQKYLTNRSKGQMQYVLNSAASSLHSASFNLAIATDLLIKNIYGGGEPTSQYIGACTL